MTLWTDERKVPEVLLQLLEVPDIPEDLRKELVQACKEVKEDGAVTYPTKARVEYYFHYYHENVSALIRKLEETRD